MPTAYERLQEAVLPGDEITRLPPVEPLIDGILDLDNIGETYGKYGAGKSFLILDWGLSVATGRDWWGHKVNRGKVLYVVGEGVTGTGPRYQAWCDYHEVHDVGPDMVWLPYAPNLLAADERSALLSFVMKERPILTILDTLARHLPGGNENESAVMSAMVETLDEIRRLTKGHAHVVHHPGKAEEAGSRGHSSLPGALDTQLEVVGFRHEKKRGLILKAEKQKNHEDGHVIARMRLHPVGPSCVLIPEGDRHPVAVRILEHLAECPGAITSHLRKLGNSATVDRELAELMRPPEPLVYVKIVGTTHQHFLTGT